MTKLQREFMRVFPFAKIERTRGNHLRIVLPNGRVVFAPTTPSDRRSLRNVRADVRRAQRAIDEQA